MKKWIVKEMAKGATLGALVSASLFGAVAIHAAWESVRLPEEYIRYCEEAGQAYNICPELLEAVIEAESGGDPNAVGKAGEIGLMQIYPKYHMRRSEALGIYTLFEPKGNIFVGADYFAELFEEYEDMGTVLMIYNGTEDAKERGIRSEYTDYAKKIMKRAEQLERMNGK